jgi:hypothetical protein
MLACIRLFDFVHSGVHCMLACIQDMNRNSAQQDESIFHTADSAQSRVSMKKKEETTFPRWKRIKRQKKILKLLFEAGERNPDRTRTKLLKLHGNIEEKNVFYWFQKSHSRKKREQQKNWVHALSLNQNEIGGSSQAPICSSRSNGKL